MPSAQVQDYASQLTDLARQLNAFAARLKTQRRSSRKQPKTVREPTTDYVADEPSETPAPLFTAEDLEWLKFVPNT